MITNDIGNLFATFEKAYGRQWKQGADAIPLWLGRLKNYTAEDLTTAAEKAIEVHTEHPPSLGQFIACLKAGKPQYQGPPLLEGPIITRTMAIANRVMTAVLMASGGVKAETLEVMKDLKNALVEDFEGKDDKGFPRNLADQLTELMNHYERETENV